MAACRHYHGGEDDNGNMRVALLGPRIKRNLYGGRRNSNGSLSCQSSVISSLENSMEDCIITDNTDTDSGIFNPRNRGVPILQSSPIRKRVPSGSSESNTPKSEDDEENKTNINNNINNNTNKQTNKTSNVNNNINNNPTTSNNNRTKPLRRRNSEKKKLEKRPSDSESSNSEINSSKK
jgi:hypothetical protein